MKQALAVAIMAVCVSFGVEAGGSTAKFDKDVLAQVMVLHGLDEHGAIQRLAAEEEAADLYRRVRSMNLPGYAGAWFDAESGKLRVALSDSTQINLLKRLGTEIVSVDWSLAELNAVQAEIMKDASLIEGGLLHSVHVDYVHNRVAVRTAPGQVATIRKHLARYNDRIEVSEGVALPELTTSVRGGDGTRNYTFEQNPAGSGFYPCSVGASTENGFHTAGHCGRAYYDIRWAADYSPLGIVGESALPDYSTKGDIGWVETLPGWTPVPQINGYSNGIINVPSIWSGTNEAPINATACRFGQTSGGPHCGKINAKGLNLKFAGVGWIANVTEVDGSCSSDGDSGGTWISGGNQIQGTTIGPSHGNTCPNTSPLGSGKFTYFQPISDHIENYEDDAGGVLSAHGASAPTVVIPFGACPDMSMSGMGTFVCAVNPYHSQGATDVTWGGGYISWSGDDAAFGTCSAFSTVTVTFNVTNPYGSFNKTWTFPCPMGPIP